MREPKNTPLARKLAQRLIDEGHLDGSEFPADRCYFQRSYAGHWQRSEGAWSWTLGYLNEHGMITHGPIIGSQYSASVVMKWKTWDLYTSHGGTHIDQGA